MRNSKLSERDVKYALGLKVEKHTNGVVFCYFVYELSNGNIQVYLEQEDGSGYWTTKEDDSEDLTELNRRGFILKAIS